MKTSAKSPMQDIRELKHQTFLIHERHGWPLRTGSGTRSACQMQIIKLNNVKPSRTPQNNSVENAFQRFALSFVSFVRRKHDFRRRILLFEEPRIWTSGFNLRTGVLKSVTAAQERLDMRSDCHTAKILPVGVRGTMNVWCLSSLFSVGRALPCRARGRKFDSGDRENVQGLTN